MHGRLKVRTTAEQDELKRQERQAKLAAFRKLSSSLLALRQAPATCGDAGERAKGLALSSLLLAKQPDVGSVWNFRRELLLACFADAGTVDTASKQQLCVEELDFLDACLKESPKSYGVWHHRAWVLQQAPEPPWTKELDKCALFLSLDSRNFHCWDYRRFVVAASGTSLTAELDFTTEKITTNFSNFSAWHNRSILLPQVHPDSTTYNGVAAETTAQEFELVTQAVYIDAADQSAWFYHRWLLGRTENAPEVCHVLVQDDAAVTLVFSQPVKLCVDVLGPEARALTWTGVSAGTHPASPLSPTWQSTPSPLSVRAWLTGVPAGAGISGAGLTSAAWALPEDTWQPVVAGSSGHAVLAARTADADHRAKLLARYGFPSPETLAQERDTCAELLAETVQSSGPGFGAKRDGAAADAASVAEQKWVRLSLVHILRGLDLVGNHDAAVEHLAFLRERDGNRRGFYDDELSRFTCERALMAAPAFPPVGALDLSRSALTLLHGTQHWLLLHRVDLSHNALASLAGLGFLASVHELVLDHNRITTVTRGDVAGLRQLKQLSLRHNLLSSVEQVNGLLALPPGVQVSLTGNAVAAVSELSHLPLVA